MSAGCHSVICWTVHVLGVQPGRLLDLHQGECDDKLGLGSKKQRSARNQRPSSEFEQEKKKPDLKSSQICVSCSGCFFSLPGNQFLCIPVHYHGWTEIWNLSCCLWWFRCMDNLDGMRCFCTTFTPQPTHLRWLGLNRKILFSVTRRSRSDSCPLLTDC